MAKKASVRTAADPQAEIAGHVEESIHDPLYFVEAMYPWREPGPLVDHDGPDDWQAGFLRELGQETARNGFDGVVAVPPVRRSVSSGHGIGKAQGYSTVIDGPSGPMVWGDIHPGVFVFGADGATTQVVARHEQGTRPIYRVSFDDGSSTLVDAEHLWNVRGRKERRNGLGGWRTLTTADLLAAGVTRANGATRARQWEIPVQGAAQFPTAQLPVAPYLMGVWLGDGSKGKGAYTKPFPEITERVRHLGYVVTDHPDGTTKYVRGLAGAMRGEDVFQCGSHERFIPTRYKYADIEQRRELLCGLLDSDGEVHQSGSIGYSTTSERLADDVAWLVRSLGGKAMRHPTTKQPWYLGDDGARIYCRPCCRLTISLDWNPFTLAHRRDAYKPSEHRYLVRWIDSIEYSHDEEAMCITVAAPDGLYLTNDFIVTHNSVMVAWLVDWLMSTRPFCRGTVTANTFTQLDTKTWASIQTWSKLLLNADWFTVTTARMYHRDYRESWFCAPQSSKEENSEAFAGQHAANSSSWYVFDEASAIPPKIWEVAEGGLTDGEPFIFAFGNPTRNNGKFHEVAFGKMRERWHPTIVDSRLSRFTNKAQIAEWVQDYGEDSDFVRVRVRGLPPAASDLQFIGLDLVSAAQARPPVAFEDDPLVAGLDIARGGADRCVIRFRRGFDARSIPPLSIPGEQARDSMRVATWAADVLGRTFTEGGVRRKVAMLFVDGTGIGGPIADRLKQMGHANVMEVQFGGHSPDPKLANMRTYMWARMREWLAKGAIDASPTLETDLTAPGYKHDKSDRVVLESKEEMAKRDLASPDDGDALALTFAAPVGVPTRRPTATAPPLKPTPGGWMRG